MKKLIYNLFGIIVLATIVSSCDNLDEKLYNQVSVDDFGKTQAEQDALVGTIYTGLQRFDALTCIPLADISGESVVIPRRGGDWWDGGAHMELTKHMWDPQSSMSASYLLNGSQDWGCWYNAYHNITLCNQLIAMLESGNNDPTVIQGSIAQIRGIRAFWYYFLIDTFGNVPIITDFYDTSLPATTIPGQRKIVYEFIIAELDAITPLLPPGGTNMQYYGKFTKGAAWAIRAKMYLNAMVWNPSAGPKWQACADACDTLFSMGYELEPVWRTNFIPQNQTSKEAIFSVVFKNGDGGNNILTMTLHYLSGEALNVYNWPWNGTSAMPQYAKAFDTINDIRFSQSFLIGPQVSRLTGEQIYTSENRPLIYSTDIPRHDMEDGWGSAYQEAGARCWKWPPEDGLNTTMENDFHIFRISDFYLMKAEALVRRDGGSNAEATDLVNAIRSRAFPNMPDKLYSSASLDDIMMERRFELAWEAYSRQDQIRFGRFGDAVPGWKDEDVKDLNDNPEWFPGGHTHYDLFPIPQGARNANPNLAQNPGYLQ